MNTLFAERLKIALDRKNMKQIDLVHRAQQQGVKLGKSHVSQYLSGKTMPRPEILRFLAATLEVDEKWLQGIGEDMELPETERFVQKNMPDFTVTGRIENATKPASQVLIEREKENTEETTMREFKKSSKLNNVLYDVRGPVVEAAERMEKAGTQVLKLNIGNPAPFGFRTPDEVIYDMRHQLTECEGCLLYTSPSPRDGLLSRMPSSA